MKSEVCKRAYYAYRNMRVEYIYYVCISELRRTTQTILRRTHRYLWSPNFVLTNEEMQSIANRLSDDGFIVKRRWFFGRYYKVTLP